MLLTLLHEIVDQNVCKSKDSAKVFSESNQMKTALTKLTCCKIKKIEKTKQKKNQKQKNPKNPRHKNAITQRMLVSEISPRETT